MVRAVVVAVLVSACGDPTAVPDARMRDAAVFEPGPNLVTIGVTEDTTDVRYRNSGAGPWGYGDKISATEYQLHVTDAYEVVVACGEEWRGETEIHARTFADGDTDFLFCTIPTAASPPPTATVTGQMLQPGNVTMWDYESSSTAPWTYSLHVLLGTQDLIAVDNQNQIAIRRDIHVTGPATLPTLDMAQEGMPTLTRSLFVFAPEMGETVSIATYLYTGHGFASMAGTATMKRELPPALLQPGDEQDFEVFAEASNTRRAVTFTSPDLNSVELLPVLPQHVFVYSVPDGKSLRADFNAPPAFTSLSISLYDTRSAQHGTFTKSWFDAMGRSYFQLDLPPEFDQTWRVSLVPEYARFTYVNDDQPDMSRYTARYDHVTNVLGN